MDIPGKQRDSFFMESRANHLKAAVWMSGSIAAFTVMAVAGRSLAGRHDVFEILTWRSAVGFVLVVLAGAATGQLRTISARRLGGHLLRNSLHFAGQNLWFWALTVIPLAQLFALEFTSPLWIILLAPLLLGERLTASRSLSVGLGLVGVLIITQPGAVPPSWGLAAAAGSAVFFALTSILTKRLSRDVSVTGILFWLTAMQFVLGLTCAALDGHVRLPDSGTAPLLALIGLCGVVAHLSLTSALRLAPASFVMPIDFLRLPVAAVVAAALYGEPLDPFVLIGGAVVLLGIWINLRGELRHAAGR
jgi:drug/metabolite transporter (DMT)-like permease